jgi:hypothetical protein
LPTLDSIRFDTADLQLQRDTPSERNWSTQAGEPVGLYLFVRPPDLPVALHDLQGLTTGFRDIARRAQRGLVEVEVVTADSCPGVRVIIKGVVDPKTGCGRFYTGSLILPFRDCSFVIKAQLEEIGSTGVRETVVTDHLLASGALRDLRSNEGWLVDAHDPTPPHLARNVSEDARYDVEFPQHPLSRVRAFLDRVILSLEIAPDVKTLAPFKCTL